MNKTLLIVLPALAGALPSAAHPTWPDPGLAYRPGFERSARAHDPIPADWRASNELARRLGGHAGHLRGSAAPAAAPASGAAPGPDPQGRAVR